MTGGTLTEEGVEHQLGAVEVLDRHELLDWTTAALGTPVGLSPPLPIRGNRRTKMDEEKVSRPSAAINGVSRNLGRSPCTVNSAWPGDMGSNDGSSFLTDLIAKRDRVRNRFRGVFRKAPPRLRGGV